jgi:hypothetical protein
VKDAEQSKKFFEVMVASSTHFNIEADWPEKLGNDDFGVSNIVIQLNKGGLFSQH